MLKRFFPALRVISVPGLARASAFLATVWLVSAVISVRMARAEVDALMLGLGADVERWAGADAREAPVDVDINGLVLRVTSVVSERSVSELLDDAERDCSRRDGRLGEQSAELLAEHGSQAIDARDYDATVREGDEGRGYVACLDMGPDRATHEDVLARVSRFLESHDVSDVGALRYVFARREGDRTHVIAAESTGTLDLDALMPREGDAPGADLPRFPRAPGLRRTFTARVGDAPYGYVTYVAEGASRDELVSWYRTALVESGYALLERDGEAPIEVDGAIGLAAEEGGASIGGRTVILTFAESEEGHGLLSVLAAEPEQD